MYSGLSLREVVESQETVDAVITETENYWPVERELLATLVEINHALLLTVQAAFGAKINTKPVHIDRPWERHPQTMTRSSTRARPRPPSRTSSAISMSEFVRRERSGTL